MLQLNLQPSNKQLRQFAGVWFPAFIGIVGWVIYKKTHDLNIVGGLWFICAIPCIIGIFYPPFIKPIFKILILVTFPLGIIISHLILGIIFWGLITPMGIMLRVFGHDPLQIRKIPNYSLWKKIVAKDNSIRYLRQS